MSEVVVTNKMQNIVQVTEENKQVEVSLKTFKVEVQAVGTKGDKGDTGDAGQDFTDYVHLQASASDTWVVAHNLGYKPSVQILNTANEVVNGDIQHISDNLLNISFAVAITGSARCI